MSARISKRGMLAYYLINLFLKLYENEEILVPGVRASLAPPPRSANERYYTVSKMPK